MTITNSMPVAQAEPMPVDSGTAYPTVTPTVVPDVYNNSTAYPSGPSASAPQGSATVPIAATTPAPTHYPPPVQRSTNSNDQAWYIIGGSIACTAMCVCCCCFVLPFILFMIIFFTAWSQTDEMSSTLNDDFWENDNFFNDNYNN